MKRVTVKDVARASGFSVATVSKTLNGTDRVSAQTMEKIRRVAEELGYRSSLSAQALVRKPRKIAIALFRHPFEVRRLFEAGFEQSFGLYEEFGLEPVYFLFDRMEDVDWRCVAETSDALILTPGLGFENCADALDEIGRHMPLVLLQSLPSALPAHRCAVTVDARAVGAMGAQLLGLCAPGAKTAVLTGYAQTWIHQENVRGYLESAPEYGVENLAVAECFDDMQRAYETTRALLEQHPSLGGIFVTSYVSPAVCRCAADLGRDVRVVGVDVFGDSADHLKDSTLSAALFQNQQRQAQLALEAVVDAFRSLPSENRRLVKPEIVLRSNLACYDWL